MGAFSIKKYFKNYFAKKKWYSILSDAVFVIIISLLIIPSTRTEVAAFFIRLTSFPPSTLDADERFTISNQARTWQLQDMDGNEISFESLNDKPIFLNFWATWCPPCIAELPSITELHEKYKNDVSFVLVSNESRAKVRAFAKKNGFNQLLFYQNKTVPNDFASQSIPTTFIISKTGVVVLDKKGVARWNSGSIEDILDELISE
ncbi:MAG: TlpA disulfide reductase family protein [Bacteroidota bacterium]